MARFEFKLPDIGEGVSEGEVVAWHVQVGDHVTEDQLMVEVMTDKATVTIGAPRSGRVASMEAAVGTVVQVGQVLVTLEGGNGSSKQPEAPTAGSSASAVGDIQESLPGAGFFLNASRDQATSATPAPRPTTPVQPGHPSTIPAPAPVPTTVPGAKALATPAVRRLARELSLELSQVPATGPGGRVTRDDVLRYSRERTAPTPPPSPMKAPLDPSGGETRIPFVGLRRKIAERMRMSKDTAAHFTFVEECDVTELIAVRSQLQPDAAAQGVQLTYLPFVIKAVVAALRKHPKLNSYLDSERGDVVMPNSYHIGVAVATGQGLVVPVVHHAEQRSLLAIAREVDRLSIAAREGRLTLDDIKGSTFTITSLGKLGGLLAVPIIHHPNAAILGIHRVKERPVVRNGEIVIGQVMNLSLSMDHRLVDGHEGAAFAYDVIHYLEAPTRLLLEG